MAAGRIVVASRMPARDLNGTPISGALLTLYENNTTTLTSIYANEGLSVPLTNPVAADSGGNWPQMWAEAGTEESPTLYSLALTDSSGVPLSQPSVFDDFRPSIDYDTATATIAEAAKVGAEAAEAGAAQYLADIQALGDAATPEIALASRAAKTANLGDLSDPEAAFNNLDFLQAETGAVAMSARAKARQLLHVKDYGVVADGATDDTAALQLAVDAAASLGADLNFGEGTILVDDEIDGTALESQKLFGTATIKAADGTDFAYLLSISGTTGVTIEGLTFDANKAGRGSATLALGCINANFTVSARLLRVTAMNTQGLSGPTSSAVAIRVSGGATGLFADGLRFINLGVGPSTKPSDGIFVRGNYCIVTNTYGEGVTDHIAVLEGSNYSQIINTTGKNCCSFVAMSNDQTTDCVGNIIDGVNGTCNHFGSFGAVVGIYTFDTGWIRGCVVTNVSVRGATGATGGGPAVLCSGNIEGDLSKMNIHPGASTGVMDQAILIDTTAGGAGVNISDSTLEVEAGLNVVRIVDASGGVNFDNVTFSGGAGGYGILASGTSSFTESKSRFVGALAGKIFLQDTASYYGSAWQNWTPVFGSDLGNEAFTFTVAPTVTRARLARDGDTITASLNFNGVLNAVTPAYLTATVPSWAQPVDDHQWTPANVLDGSTYETGIIRTDATNDVLRLYRANVAAFTSGAAVSGRVCFSYEVA